MSLETEIETITWLNTQLNKITARTEYLDEMIQETEDEFILQFLQQKLEFLEKECILIGNKIDFEKNRLVKFL